MAQNLVQKIKKANFEFFEILCYSVSSLFRKAHQWNFDALYSGTVPE